MTGMRNGNSYNDQDTVTFHAENQRGKTGRTDLSFLRDRYSREQENALPISGVRQSADLSDTETWGRDDWIVLRSLALYNRLSETDVPQRSLAVIESLDLQHTADLRSGWRGSVNTSRSGSVDTDSRDASALLRHQLYRSLTSTVDVRASTQESTGPDSRFLTERRGAGWDESYTKKLPARGRISLGAAVRVGRERRESSGRLLSVVNERHQLLDGVPSFLDQPNVETVTLVTDPVGVPYTESLDYILVPQGLLTEIRRVPGGLIPDGGEVLVSYTAEAPPSDTYTTLGSSARARLELFDRLAALYYRVNRVSNRGGESLVLQELTDWVAGAEFTRRWLHAGAEYEEFRSNLSPYRAARFFQSLAFEPTAASALSLDLTQSRTFFPDTGFSRRSYGAIGRYRHRIFSPLSLSLEGGLRIERGDDIDQDLKTARAYLDFAYGKLTARAGYEYLEDEYEEDLHVKSRVFLNVRRMF
ncbi:MAG: hypothetical protein IH611_08745 [Deltaproteobacteria bacterium]|nr:hypothetical protein [Deltaproteobacteria bacterium]